VYADDVSVPARVSPMPIVGRRAIVLAYDPLRPGSTKARFQMLRAARVVSSGVNVTRRGGSGRIRGRLHVYSELNREAARLYRRGDAAAARALAESATKLESQHEFILLVERLSVIGTPEGLDVELAWPDVERLFRDAELAELIRAAAAALEAFRGQSDELASAVHTVTGVVAGMQSSMAILEGVYGTFLVPVEQLARLQLDRIGASVELQWEAVEPAIALVSAIPAIPVDRMAENVLPSPYASTPPPSLSEERWRSLRALAAAPGVGPPPLPVALPSE
jgi:hypothetical protein